MPDSKIGKGIRDGGDEPARGRNTVAAKDQTTEGALTKGTRITGPERDKLAADLKKKYDKGESIRVLAENSGRSYGFVHRILSESGTTLRGRGGATRGKKTT